MNIFRKKYFILPEVQGPLIKQIAISLLIVSLLQCFLIYAAMKWLEAQIQADLTLIVDYRVLGAWRLLLYFAVLIPLVMNFFIGVGIMLHVSNRFAGPIFRLERELDQCLADPQRQLSIQFRKNDYLKSLAEKMNRLLRQ